MDPGSLSHCGARVYKFASLVTGIKIKRQKDNHPFTPQDILNRDVFRLIITLISESFQYQGHII
jgi:hypothetical protein